MTEAEAERGPVDAREAIERRRLVREGTTMALYVAMVLLAELIALSEESGWELFAIVWGSTIGLVAAHAFAFQVATHGLTGGRMPPDDRAEVRAELVGAVVIALVATVPILAFRADTEIEAVRYALSVAIGVVGYIVERENGRSRTVSLVFGAAVLVIALAIALLKKLATGH